MPQNYADSPQVVLAEVDRFLRGIPANLDGGMYSALKDRKAHMAAWRENFPAQCAK